MTEIKPDTFKQKFIDYLKNKYNIDGYRLCDFLIEHKAILSGDALPMIIHDIDESDIELNICIQINDAEEIKLINNFMKSLKFSSLNTIKLILKSMRFRDEFEEINNEYIFIMFERPDITINFIIKTVRSYNLRQFIADYYQFSFEKLMFDGNICSCIHHYNTDHFEKIGYISYSGFTRKLPKKCIRFYIEHGFTIINEDDWIHRNEPNYIPRYRWIDNTDFNPEPRLDMNLYLDGKYIHSPFCSHGWRTIGYCDEYVHDTKKMFIMAIIYLQLNKIKELLTANPDLVNATYDGFEHEDNIIEILCSGQLFPSKYSYDANTRVYEEIIKLILSINPSLITKKAIENAYVRKHTGIINVLNLFAISKNICIVCYCSHPEKMLIYPCKCKSPIHAECVIKVIQTSHSRKCKICLTDYEINEPKTQLNFGGTVHIDERIYFPKFNIYPVPIMTRMPLERYIKDNDIIYMAIIYLQVKRVIELLENDTEKKYKSAVLQPLQYLKNHSVPSNYPYECNTDDYETLISIIESYLLA